MEGNPAYPPPGSPAAWVHRKESMESYRGRPAAGVPDNLGKMARNASPVRGPSPTRGLTPSYLARSVSPVRNPFNFESKFVSASPAKPSQRRGHRYKHSSVSLNYFQEPEARAPLPIPVSLTVPTFRECYQSISRLQLAKFGWCFVRFACALILYSCDHGALQSAEALAHLVAYDAVMDTIVVGVGVLSNFEVWKRSSLRLPFALQRVEILVGFSLAICLVFVGAHMASHTIQELAYLFYGESHNHGHHAHQGEDAAASGLSGMMVGVILSLLFTVLSLVGAGAFTSPKLLWDTHAFTCITALFAVAVLVVGVIGNWLVDFLLMPSMAAAMIYFGWQTSKLLGGMLVMSYGGPDRAAQISSKISQDERVASVPEVSLWQVHHDLWLASIKVVVTGRANSSGLQPIVRDLVANIVDAALADLKDARVEVTIDIS